MKKGLKGIGVLGTIIGEVTRKIHFAKLRLTIDVDFAVMKDDSPTLLSNIDMITNGLDISKQLFYLYVGPHKEPIALGNYFCTPFGPPEILHT